MESELLGDGKAQRTCAEVLGQIAKTRADYGRLRALEELLMAFLLNSAFDSVLCVVFTF